MVQLDDFIFDLWPYCDQDLRSHSGSSEYSAVNGLGVSMLWAYNGPALTQKVTEDLACEGEPLGEFGFKEGLSAVDTGGYSGGIRLPEGALEQALQSTKPISCTIVVSVGDTTYSAYLEFALHDTGAGMDLTGVAVKKGAP